MSFNCYANAVNAQAPVDHHAGYCKPASIDAALGRLPLVVCDPAIEICLQPNYRKWPTLRRQLSAMPC